MALNGSVNTQTSYAGIDLLKLIMSVVVVAIHTHPFENWDDIPQFYNILKICAVPYFFLCSGFLIGKKIFASMDPVQQQKIVEKYIKSFFKIYVIWNVIYLPITIYYLVNISTAKSFFIKMVVYIRDLVFIGQQYNSWILWYILSSVYALLFIRFSIKKKFFSKLPICIALFFVLLIFLHVFSECDFSDHALINLKKCVSFIFDDGRILTGCVFIPLGIILAKYKVKKAAIFMFSIIGSLIYFSTSISLISSLFLSVAIFLTALCINTSKIPNAFIWMRKISIGVYFTHLWIWTIVYSILYGSKTYGAEVFFLTISFSLISTLVYYMIVQRIKARKNVVQCAIVEEK